jgi:hypothetical protein
MNNYKVTPEQWYGLRTRVTKLEKVQSNLVNNYNLINVTITGLLDKLEAQASNYPEIPDSSTPPPVATDEELRDIWDRAFDLRAIYILGMNHGQASSREVAEPAPVAGGLVERVSDAITSETGSRWASTEARAAILEVETWLREQGWEEAADLLEQEAGQ